MRLERPIVFFDLETTGTRVHRDQVVQIAMIKVADDWIETSKISVMVKPTVPIPPDAQAIHGISDEMVKNHGKFKDIARSIYDYIDGCDLAGYNLINFDVPILARQIGECLGYDYRKKVLSLNFIDVFLINQRLNKRMKLGDVYNHYFGRDIENAHDAIADVNATVQICREMCKRYNIEVTNESLINETRVSQKPIQEKQFFAKNGKEIVFNFGKHVNKTLQQVYEESPSYLDFVLLTGFPNSAKKIVEEFLSQK